MTNYYLAALALIFLVIGVPYAITRLEGKKHRHR
jgi:hypothetical protein